MGMTRRQEEKVEWKKGGRRVT